MGSLIRDHTSQSYLRAPGQLLPPPSSLPSSFLALPLLRSSLANLSLSTPRFYIVRASRCDPSLPSRKAPSCTIFPMLFPPSPSSPARQRHVYRDPHAARQQKGDLVEGPRGHRLGTRLGPAHGPTPLVRRGLHLQGLGNGGCPRRAYLWAATRRTRHVFGSSFFLFCVVVTFPQRKSSLGKRKTPPFVLRATGCSVARPTIARIATHHINAQRSRHVKGEPSDQYPTRAAEIPPCAPNTRGRH